MLSQLDRIIEEVLYTKKVRVQCENINKINQNCSEFSCICEKVNTNGSFCLPRRQWCALTPLIFVALTQRINFLLTLASVSSWKIGTKNFPGNLAFLNLPFPGKFMSGFREIFLL